MWREDSAKTKASRKAITTANLHQCFMKDVFTKVKSEDIIKEKWRKLAHNYLFVCQKDGVEDAERWLDGKIENGLYADEES